MMSLNTLIKIATAEMPSTNIERWKQSGSPNLREGLRSFEAIATSAKPREATQYRNFVCDHVLYKALIAPR